MSKWAQKLEISNPKLPPQLIIVLHTERSNENIYRPLPFLKLVSGKCEIPWFCRVCMVLPAVFDSVTRTYHGSIIQG